MLTALVDTDLTQALWAGQSVLVAHSGLQEGGVPVYPCRQLHAAEWLLTLQEECGPQEEAEQGSTHLPLNSRHVSFPFQLSRNLSQQC